MSIAGKKMTLRPPKIPNAPRSIQKGKPLKDLLNQEGIECLAQNILYVHEDFEAKTFCQNAFTGKASLGLMQRGQLMAKDHPEVVFATCERWLQESESKDLQSLIRHAIRHPTKKGDVRALKIREATKGN